MTGSNWEMSSVTGPGFARAICQRCGWKYRAWSWLGEKGRLAVKGALYEHNERAHVDNTFGAQVARMADDVRRIREGLSKSGRDTAQRVRTGA